VFLVNVIDDFSLPIVTPAFVPGAAFLKIAFVFGSLFLYILAVENRQ